MKRILAVRSLIAERGNARVIALAQVILMKCVALGMNLGTGLLTATVLGAVGRGEQAAIGVGQLVLSSLATLGLHASLIYNSKETPGRERDFIGAATLFSVGAGAAAASIGWFVIPRWLHDQSATVIASARFMLLFTPVTTCSAVLAAVLERRGLFGWTNRLLFGQSVATLVVLVVLWRMHALTPTSSALSYIGPTVPGFLILLTLAIRLGRPRLDLGGGVVRLLLAYGFRFYAMDVLVVVGVYLDQIVVVSLLSIRDVGLYAVALSLSRMLNVIQGAVTTVLFPAIAARSVDEVLDIVGAVMRVTSVVGLAAAACLWVIAGPAVTWAYGRDFAGAVQPFRILVLEVLVSNAARIFYQVFTGTGRPATVSLFEGLGLGASIALMIVLAPRAGLEGAAIAMLLGGILRLASVLAGVRFLLGRKLPPLVLRPADLRRFLRAREAPAG